MSETKPKDPKAAPIQAGELVYTSVSAMQTADHQGNGCLRKYVFKYRENLPDKEPGKMALYGIAGHGRIEKTLLWGTNVLTNQERKGIERGYIPEWNKDGKLLIEQKLREGIQHVHGCAYFLSTEEKPVPCDKACATPRHSVKADGVPLTGRADLVNTRFLAETGVLRITDWKFKGDDRFTSTAHSLVDEKHPNGIQMLGYDNWAIVNKHLFPGLRTIENEHVVFHVNAGPPVARVAVSIGLTEATQKWETVSRRIVPPLREAIKAEIKDIPKNLSMCDSFGGCPYKMQCLDPMTRIAQGANKAAQRASGAGEKQMGMLSRATGKTAPVPPPAQVTTPAPIQTASAKPQIVDVPTGSVLASEAKAGEKYTVNGVVAQFVSVVKLPNNTFASFFPLDGSPPLQVPIDTPVAAYVEPVAAAPAPTPTPAEPIQAESEAPKKRGRRGAASTPDNAVAPTASGGFSLYFVGSPVGHATDTLNEYVEALDAAIQGAFKTEFPDLRAATGDVLGFGKWKSILAKASLEAPPTGGHFIVTTADERITVVADALSSRAGLVVR